VTRSAEPVPYRVLSVRTIVWSAAVILLLGVGIAMWLLLAYGGGSDANRNRLDAIRTAGAIVAGAGGAVALLLAARRQRSTEIALKHGERVAEDARQDATERRITDLYTAAVEQLGSEKAAVRLGGLYALERLAQNVPAQRQTIVNVICAYLRMPYELPAPELDAGENRTREQERQVRFTAQRILTLHLRPSTPAFWPDIDLDLTGAVLPELDLSNCRIRSGRFVRAQFTTHARFEDTIFTGNAQFQRATITDRARFDRTQFLGEALFTDTSFPSATSFAGAQFAKGKPNLPAS
jgi:Pentapeptide repeats (9 copies)